MQKAVETAARIAAEAGAKVTELTLPPILEDAYAAQYIIQDYENVRALAFEYDRHRDRIDPLLRDHLDRRAGDLRRRNTTRRGAPRAAAGRRWPTPWRTST